MTRHLGISVRGNLLKPDRQLVEDWAGEITDDTGKVLNTARDLRTFWMDQLSMGREVIPAGDSNACPEFDYKKGCPWHDRKQSP